MILFREGNAIGPETRFRSRSRSAPPRLHNCLLCSTRDRYIVIADAERIGVSSWSWSVVMVSLIFSAPGH